MARLHSGDLSIYSALAEQLRRLDRRGIPYTLTPGVPAFAAAAAALQCELTVPEVAQSVVLTRVSGRASRMPEGEKLATFAASGATLVIHLAIHADRRDRRGAHAVLRRRLPGGGRGAGELARSSASCAARSPTSPRKSREARIERTALILVGRALAAEDFRDSALYDADYRRRFRGGARDERRSDLGRCKAALRPTRFCSRSNNTISTAMSRPAITSAAVCCAARATASPSAMPSACASAKASAAVFAPRMRSHSCGRTAGRRGKVRQLGKIDLAALGMQIGQALRELGHLGDAAGDGDARHRMAAQIFEHAADEIAHVDQRDLRQAVKLLHAGFGTRAGRAGDMGEAGGARDIDAGMDRMNPGRARIGHDDAGGAEDRQAADDAEPAVERFRRQRFAAGNGNLDLDIGGAAGRGGDFGDGVA